MKEQLTKLTNDYLNINNEIAALTEKKDLLKAQIKLLMENNNTDREEDLNGNLVTYKESTRESVDKKKVLALLGEIRFKEVVKVGKPFTTLRITTAKQLEMLKSMKENKK